MALVAPEAPSEQARRVFQTYDPEGKTSYIDTPVLFKRWVGILNGRWVSVLKKNLEKWWNGKQDSKDTQLWLPSDSATEQLCLLESLVKGDFLFDVGCQKPGFK